jgi:hypothetical protein
MRDVPRNRHLDATVGAASQAVRAVRPGEIERRAGAASRGSTRSLAPDRGGWRPIPDSAREAAAFAGGHTERERGDRGEPSSRHVRSTARPDGHASEPSAAKRELTCRVRAEFEKQALLPLGPDPYTLMAT